MNHVIHIYIDLLGI